MVRWVFGWLCLGGIILLRGWSHEPSTNVTEFLRKKTKSSVSTTPYWQVPDTNHVSGRAEKFKFFCPTKNAYLQAKFCDPITPTIVVQDEQRIAKQGATAANDAQKCRTKVRSMRKLLEHNNARNLINFSRHCGLISTLHGSEERQRNLQQKIMREEIGGTGGKMTSRRAAALSGARVRNTLTLRENNSNLLSAQSESLQNSR